MDENKWPINDSHKTICIVPYVTSGTYVCNIDCANKKHLNIFPLHNLKFSKNNALEFSYDEILTKYTLKYTKKTS